MLEQLDGFVQSEGINMLLQIKNYDGKVNVELIAKLRKQLLRPSTLVNSALKNPFQYRR